MKKTLYSTLTVAAFGLLFTACAKSPEIPAEPDAAIEKISREVGAGNTGILWKAMPATYQSDVNGLVQLASTKLDAEMYEQTFAMFGRLADVAQKQKDFILNTQMLQGQSAEEKAKLEASLPGLIGVVKTLSQSDLSTIAGLQGFDGQAFFETTVAELAQYAVELSKLSDAEQTTLEDLKQAAVEVVERTENEATLKISVPGSEPESEVYRLIEGRWVPAEMADEWSTQMADAKAKLEALSVEEMTANKPQIMGVLTMFTGVLDQLDAAETQQQFDTALQGAMMPIMGLMMMGQGGGAQPMAPSMPAEPVAE
ncbi:hypothetical protein [Coraliomargarita parva]|uniref:hypothetical protein n=1 Tax=Coraliomargarita parva TaxID=3014050 RepID=UPI0022B399A3|nr:hypothetical protein [Coraliomargarita parva]